MTSDKSDALTLAQKEQLEAELAELEGPRRAEAVQAIATARSFGDLSENFEYHVDGDTIGVGTKVEIEDEQGERMEVEISSVGGVSPDSPVGRALMGHKVSDEVEIQAPSGSWRARILSIGR